MSNNKKPKSTNEEVQNMYNENDLDLSGIDMIEQRNFEREFCQGDKIKLTLKDKIIAVVLVLIILSLLVINHKTGYLDESKNLSTVGAAELPIFVICDAEYDEDGDFLVTLPNGNVFGIDNNLTDTPDSIREVVIRTTNIDDTTSYEIVGLR